MAELDEDPVADGVDSEREEELLVAEADADSDAEEEAAELAEEATEEAAEEPELEPTLAQKVWTAGRTWSRKGQAR